MRSVVDVTATVAPSRTRVRAVANPMPIGLPHPVTRAVFPASSSITDSCQRRTCGQHYDGKPATEAARRLDEPPTRTTPEGGALRAVGVFGPAFAIVDQPS